MIDPFVSSLIVRAIGWAIVQSIWQGTLIGVITALALATLRRGDATRRYLVACLGLAVMVAVPAWTAAGQAYGLRTITTSNAPAVAPAFPGRNPTLPREDAGAGIPAPVSSSAADARRWSNERLELWSALTVPLWLLGVVVVSARLVASWLIVERIRAAATGPLSAALCNRVESIAAKLRVLCPLRILESAVADVPMVIGWLRPVILLPASALTGLSPAQLDAVIAHELAHVRRHDYLVNIVQMTIETLLFYHPVTWWISRQIRLEREHCCDDLAVEVCGDRLAYAEALASLEELRDANVVLGMAATSGPLLRRVRRVLGLSPEANHSPTWIVVGVLLMALSLTVVGEGVPRTQTPGSRVPGVVVDSAAAAPDLPRDKGAIRGRITEAPSGRPVAGASVEIARFGQQDQAASPVPPLSVTNTTTDANGRYEANGLEPGDYRVSAAADGYVQTEYGQQHFLQNGTSISIRGGYATDVDVALGRAGVLAGRILNDRGDGFPGIEIQVLGERYLPGGRLPVSVAFAQTDETGGYQVRDLPPGSYHVKAYASRQIPSSHNRAEVYAPTFYPRAASIEDAQQLLIREGEKLFDIDFPLLTVKPRVLTGRLVDPGRTLDQLTILLRFDGITDSSELTKSARVAADGTFRIENVLPGYYHMMVSDPEARTLFPSRGLELHRDHLSG